jgi:tetratricopeptide (TPR) repeat protein
MAPLREDQLPPANRIFVDRVRPQGIFENTAFGIPADRSKVLVFYGAGGEGKTALCRELWRKCDSAIEPSYNFLRRAQVDLHGRQKDDPDLLLIWIRNGFAESGIPLPAFDLALALTWKATRGEQPFPKLSRPWLKRTTAVAKGAVDGAADKAKDWLKSDTAVELLGDAVSELPGLGFLIKWAGGWVVDKTKRAYLEYTRDFLKELYDRGDLKKPYELSKLLPWMLAQDLNCYLTAHPTERFVLFIDEYERVFHEGGAGVRWRDSPFDTQLRQFIQNTNGLLVVFFSRERLPWEADPEWRDDVIDRQHLLGGLADKDAEEFLSAIPIESADIRRAIIHGARETSGPTTAVYPLMLDLQVEHWRTIVAKKEAVTPERFHVAAESFEGRRRELVTRVLRDYGEPLQTTLERLSVARRFDRAAFEHVVKTFGTGLPLDKFDRITDLSFVTRTADGYVTIHNVIAEVIRETLDLERRRTSTDALLEHYAARAHVEFPSEVTDVTVAALIEAAFLRRTKGIDGYTDWLYGALHPIVEAGRYSSAIPLWREALESVKDLPSPEHRDTANILNNLAACLQQQGDLTGARPLYERALAISEKVLGPEHRDTGTTLSNLALLIKDQGDSAGARPLFKRALAIREKVPGPEHPDTASTLDNFAALLHAQGDLAGARPLYERALAIREKVLGPDYPTTAISLNNLALLLKAQRELAGARPLLERALAMSEKLFGPEHHNTGTTLNNLALLLEAQRDLAGARPLLERALAIREKVRGPEHPETAATLNNLGTLLKDQGDLAGARPLLERALAICEKVPGPEHRDTANILNNLAACLQQQGDLTGARPLYERALAIREKILGAEHPDTDMSVNNLATLLREQGDLAGARPLEKRALAVREKRALSRRRLYERALAIREEVLGPEHPATATSLNSLALLLRDQGDLAGARRLFKRALAIRKKILGPEHPDTAAVREHVAMLGRWRQSHKAPRHHPREPAIDNELRGCDVVSLRVGDVVLNGYAPPRATIRRPAKR